MEAFECSKCVKTVEKYEDGAYLSLCFGSTRLATRCYCKECGKTVAKEMVNSLYGTNHPVTIEERRDADCF